MNVNCTFKFGRSYNWRHWWWWTPNLELQLVSNKDKRSLKREHVRFLYLTMKNLESWTGWGACSFSGATERVDFQMATDIDLSRSLSVNSRTRIKTPNVSGHMLARTIGSYGFPAGNAPDHNVYTLSRTRCVGEANSLMVVYNANQVPVPVDATAPWRRSYR